MKLAPGYSRMPLHLLFLAFDFNHFLDIGYMEEFWNERYGKEEFAYGTNPNVFFKNQLDEISTGKILLPADGEGRNSVYAAQNGWEVYACDLSLEGKQKAETLARQNNVLLNYQVGDFGNLSYPESYFDAIALIYAHFPSDKKSDYHKLVDNYLKPGGLLLFEAFGKKQLRYNSVNPNAGGPKDFDMLYSSQELETDFPNYEIKTLEEVEVDLSEGVFHRGTGSVVRFVAQKN